MKKLIRRLNYTDARQYENLLAEAFGNARGFAVLESACKWGQAENFYPTLGIFYDEVLVSAMRVESVLSEKELNFKLPDAKYSDTIFPAMYLTKAASKPKIMGQGLNAILRYFSLQIAVQWGVRYIYGSMLEGSSRVYTMQEMGYEFQPGAKPWRGHFQSERPPLIARLDMQTQGSRAMKYLESLIGSSLSEYDVQLDVKSIALITNSKEKWPWSA